MRLIVLAPVSARLFEWGLYAEVRQCWTPQLLSSSLVVLEANSGPPSVVSVEGIPNVANVSLKVWASPVAPLVAGETMGQPE